MSEAALVCPNWEWQPDRADLGDYRPRTYPLGITTHYLSAVQGAPRPTTRVTSDGRIAQAEAHSPPRTGNPPKSVRSSMHWLWEQINDDRG